MPVKPILPFGSTPESDTFQIYSKKPAVRFLKQGVQPPSQVYVTVDDDIVVGCASSATNEAVTVTYRLLRADGELINGQFIVRPTSNRAITVHSESLAEGFLLSVSCKAAVAVTRGQTFVRVFLGNPALGAGVPSYMLMSDYVTTAMAPAHPNGRQIAPVEGPGRPFTVNIANPAPGAPFTFQVPANTRWKARGINFNFLTSAAVGNRFVFLVTTTSGIISYQGTSDKLQAPSSICVYGGAALAPTVSPDLTRGTVPLPPELILLGNDVLNVLAGGIDAADQFSFPDLMVEEWLDNV